MPVYESELVNLILDKIMDFLDILGDATEEISVTVGGEKYENIFTKIGSIVGGGWETVGTIADDLTDDININIDDFFDDVDW